MPRDPRYIPPNSLQHVVDVAFQNRFLLRPSAALNQRFLGVLGKAQKDLDMIICAVVVLSSHVHYLLRPKDGQHLAEFMCFLKTNLAKEIGGRLRGWNGRFFHGRYHSTTVANEETDQVAVLRYILSHGPKEFLVDRIHQWPGVHSALPTITGEPMIGTWYDRTKEFKEGARAADSDSFASEQRVDLSPLPCWEHLPETTWRQAVSEIVDDIDQEAAQERGRTGKTSLGIASILAADPRHRPHDPEKSPKPRFHAADPQVLRTMVEIWREVIRSFREASQQLRSGDRNAEFPEGTFPPSLAFVPFTDIMTGLSRGQPA